MVLAIGTRQEQRLLGKAGLTTHLHGRLDVETQRRIADETAQLRNVLVLAIAAKQERRVVGVRKPMLVQTLQIRLKIHDLLRVQKATNHVRRL